MAEFIKKIKCGDKTYNISGCGKDVYFSFSSKTGGYVNVWEAFKKPL